MEVGPLVLREVLMMRVVRAGCTATFVLVLAVATYGSPQQGQSRVPSRTFRISGVVGVEGKTLISRVRRLWSVQNASALSAAEGRRVVVKVVSASDPNQIEVLMVWVEPEAGGARLSDAAFRR